MDPILIISLALRPIQVMLSIIIGYELGLAQEVCVPF